MALWNGLGTQAKTETESYRTDPRWIGSFRTKPAWVMQPSLNATQIPTLASETGSARSPSILRGLQEGESGLETPIRRLDQQPPIPAQANPPFNLTPASGSPSGWPRPAQVNGESLVRRVAVAAQHQPEYQVPLQPSSLPVGDPVLLLLAQGPAIGRVPARVCRTSPRQGLPASLD